MLTALQKSKEDAPVFESYYEEDPYKCEDKRCILCPKRYLVDIRPSWRNPKLLAQFVSPHTGLVYDKHITGLCDSMQLIVKKEVGKAQSTGKYRFQNFIREHSLHKAGIKSEISAI